MYVYRKIDESIDTYLCYLVKLTMTILMIHIYLVISIYVLKKFIIIIKIYSIYVVYGSSKLIFF